MTLISLMFNVGKYKHGGKLVDNWIIDIGVSEHDKRVGDSSMKNFASSISSISFCLPNHQILQIQIQITLPTFMCLRNLLFIL